MSMFQFVRIAVNLLQIMAGDDSPTEKKEEFHFGRSTPPPTTSYVSASVKQHDHGGDVTTVAEPPKEDKEKDKDKDKEKEKDEKDEIDVLRSDSHPSHNNPDEIRSKIEDESSNRREKREDKDWNRDKDGSGKKIDGCDVLDGQWIPPKDTKQQQYADEEDDNCTVKCLYYTMQCCECSIS